MSENVTSSMEPTEVDQTTLILTCIQAGYGIPSFILMIFFLFYLGCRKSYSHSFYRLVQLDLFTNIILYANTWIGIRFETFPLFIPLLKGIETHIPGALTWSKTLTNWFFHMQFCTAAALSLHRITSVVFHTNYEFVWKRFYILFGLICALYSFLPVLSQPGKIQEVHMIDDVLTKVIYPSRYAKRMNQVGIFSAIYFILLLVLGLGTAFLIHRKFNAVNVSDRGVSRKLTLIALTYCLVYTGILMWSVVGALDSNFAFLPMMVRKLNAPLLVFASDMMTLALPYILIIFDSNVKQELCTRKKMNGSQIFVANVTTAVSR